MPKKINIDLKGQRFNKLTAIKEVSYTKRTFWLCQCDCDPYQHNLKLFPPYQLLKGRAKSCGCASQEFRLAKVKTHGLTKHPLYRKWRNMIERCTNPTNKNYHNYQGRGITVCDEWKDPKSFIEWGLANGWEEGLEIDRANNNEGYYPENCQFVTKKENCNNRRTNIKYKDLSLIEAVNQYAHKSVTIKLVYNRLRIGWNIEDALKTPKRELNHD